MIDMKLLRQEPERLRAGLRKRGADESLVDLLIEADAERRAVETELQILRARRKAIAAEVADARRAGREVLELVEEGREIGLRVQALETTARAAGDRARDLALAIPAELLDDVPDGADESANRVVAVWGDPAPAGPAHWAFGPALGLDAEAGAALSGARFTVLRGQIARLHRALGQFMLDLATTEHGYEEIAPPLLVREAALIGTGQLPKFEEDLFRAGDHYLIPTAEVPLTNLVAGKILTEGQLPLRYAALTACFRAEAGAAGRDLRGFIRQHQFEKVEMVSIVPPEAARDELARMTRCAETVLERLELPYRRVLKCAGDTGFGAAMTFDLEVWLPGQAAYREISSCSTAGDFQARRMAARIRGRDEYPHTLNGSGVAVGRALVAVLENGLQADGSIRVPEVLRPWMGGIDTLRPA